MGSLSGKYHYYQQQDSTQKAFCTHGTIHFKLLHPNKIVTVTVMSVVGETK